MTDCVMKFLELSQATQTLVGVPCTVHFPYLKTCGVRKLEQAKEKGGAGYEASNCFMTLDVTKNTSPKYIGR